LVELGVERTHSEVLCDLKQHPVTMSGHAIQGALVSNHVHNIFCAGQIIDFDNIEPLHVTDEDPLLSLNVR
jgi:hypothetical protein